jgi:tyrocidine synthetase-3
VEEKEYYPLSPAQKRLFFLEQFEQIGSSYNISTTVRLKGKLDVETFEKALKKLIRHHETLRTSFEFINETPVQRIHREVNFKIQVIQQGNKGIQQVIDEFVKPFDLTCPPLLQAAILKLSTTEYILLLDMHHIISDGTSMGVVIENLTRIYSGNTPGPLKIQYKNFSLWQNNLYETGKFKKQMDYWLNRFAGEIPVLELPGDYPRPPTLSFEGGHYHFYLETGETEKLMTLNKEMGVTLYMNLIMGRPHADLQKIIGMFVNFLAMRNYPQPAKTYREFLKEVKKNTLQAFENQDVQFEELVLQLNLERDPSRNPLFDVTFVVQNFENHLIRVPGLAIVPYERENKTSKFDLTLFAYEDETNNRLAFNFEYALQLFKRETIETIASHFREIINQVTQNKHITLKDIFLSEDLLVPQARKIKEEEGDFEF